MPKFYFKKHNLLLSILLVIAFFWAYSSYIHSSEFWSIYISKKFFDYNFVDTIKMKPLLHLLLYGFHLLPLNDLQHIIAVKLIFSILACFQIFLFSAVLIQKSRQHTFLNYLLLSVALSGSLYLENFFRIRVDQLCLTLFMLYLWKRNTIFFEKTDHVLLLSLLLPALGLKGIFFSGLILIIHFFKKQWSIKVNFRFFLLLLASLALTVQMLLFGWNSFIYFINSYESYSQSLPNAVLFLKENFAILSVLTFTIVAALFKKTKAVFFSVHERSVVLSLLPLAIIFLSPQKFNFFIASFIPLFYIFMSEILLELKKIRPRWFIFFILILSVNLCFNFYNDFQNNPYRSNSAQLNFIDKISKQLGPHHFTYLDGMGLLPRQNNVNCLVSPNDWQSNTFCEEIIRNNTADIIIQTQRLSQRLPLGALPNKSYHAIGANVFLNDRRKQNITLTQDTPPASLVFGFER